MFVLIILKANVAKGVDFIINVFDAVSDGGLYGVPMTSFVLLTNFNGRFMSDNVVQDEDVSDDMSTLRQNVKRVGVIKIIDYGQAYRDFSQGNFRIAFSDGCTFYCVILGYTNDFINFSFVKKRPKRPYVVGKAIRG